MQNGLISRSRIIAWQCFILILLPVIAQAQSSAEDPAPSRIIVKWKAQSSRPHTQSLETASNDLHKVMGLALRHRRGISEHMEGLQLEAPLTRKDFEKALARLKSNPDVEFAVEDKRRFPHALTKITPNDQYFLATSGRTGQWYMNNVEISAIDAVTAWNYSTGGTAGSGVIVAVVDTGILGNHPDLVGKVLPGYDFIDCDQGNCVGSGLTYLTANDGDGRDADPSDPGDWVSSEDKAAHPTIFKSSCDTGDSSWHGTRVAGIIGAATNNEIGIAGIGYNARILPIRALGKCGGYDSDITAGMRWAAGLSVPGVAQINPTPAKVINLSLGSAEPCSKTAYPSVVSELINAGITIVASAGNDSAAVNVPANCAGVIGVTAIRNAGTKVGFSSLGPEVSISAPGGNCGTGGNCAFSIDTTTNLGTSDNTQTCPTSTNANAKCHTTPGVNDYTDQINSNLGTSFSAPIVSGTIALMLGANPNLTPNKIITQLKATATAFPQTATNTCTAPGTPPIPSTDINAQECNCTTSLCGAGMVNALKAVQSIASPNIVITGNATVALSGTDALDASTSTSANGTALTYAWSILTDTSNAATPRTGSTSSFMVTAPNINETLVVHLIVTDGLGNTGSKDFSIAVGTGGSSSSSASSSSSSSSSASSSSVASSSSSSLTVTGATKGGGAMEWQWLVSLAALMMMRAVPYQATSKLKR